MKFSGDSITELLLEAESLRLAGESYGSILRLAIAEFFADKLSVSEKAVLQDRIRKIEFTSEERTKVVEKTNAEVQKLIRLFDSTDTLVVEEIYLIVSLRINLGLLSQFLARHCIVDSNIPLDSIDEEIRELRTTPKMKALFNKVIQSVHENSGVLLRGTSVDMLPH